MNERVSGVDENEAGRKLVQLSVTRLPAERIATAVRTLPYI
jgi:hypothetical protein